MRKTLKNIQFLCQCQHHDPIKCHYPNDQGWLGPLLLSDWWIQHWLSNFNVLGFWRRFGLHQLVIIFKIAFSNKIVHWFQVCIIWGAQWHPWFMPLHVCGQLFWFVSTWFENYAVWCFRCQNKSWWSTWFATRYIWRMGRQSLHRVWNHKVPLREEMNPNHPIRFEKKIEYWRLFC